jgi:hypothetical protein
VENHNDREEFSHCYEMSFLMTWEKKEKEDESYHLYILTEDGVSGVEIDGDNGLDDTSGTISTGLSFCFFLLSYTYLT